MTVRFSPELCSLVSHAHGSPPALASRTCVSAVPISGIDRLDVRISPNVPTQNLEIFGRRLDRKDAGTRELFREPERSQPDMRAAIHDDGNQTRGLWRFHNTRERPAFMRSRPLCQAEGLINVNLLHDDPVGSRRAKPDLDVASVGICISITLRSPDLISLGHANRKYATVPCQRPKDPTAFRQRSDLDADHFAAPHGWSWHPLARLGECINARQTVARPRR